VKRLALVAAFAIALPLAAAEPWVDAYNKGVAAVNSSNYKLAASELQKAIAETPSEAVGLRTRGSIITYVPHFWLGIAKYNLGDIDGALREFDTSEKQGAIGRTEYYATMKTWVARTQTEKKRLAQSAASGGRKAAADAINAAALAQSDALSANADRTDSYRSATRMLQDANAKFRQGGTDIAAYSEAAQIAARASSLFTVAADEALKLRAARPPVVPKKKDERPTEVVIPFDQGTATVEPPKPVPAKPVVVEPPPTEVITKAEQDTIVAAQEKKRVVPTPAPVAEKKTPVVEIVNVPPPVKTPNVLGDAWRAFASGDFAGSEALLTKMLGERPTAEAYLLRGCARYTRVMLSRTPDAQRSGAVDDFKAALQQNRALRLDSRAFSPKLIAFFEDVRRSL
jgi:tetratricopeptide (TPR) repeat protein